MGRAGQASCSGTAGTAEPPVQQMCRSLTWNMASPWNIRLRAAHTMPSARVARHGCNTSQQAGGRLGSTVCEHRVLCCTHKALVGVRQAPATCICMPWLVAAALNSLLCSCLSMRSCEPPAHNGAPMLTKSGLNTDGQLGYPTSASTSIHLGQASEQGRWARAALVFGRGQTGGTPGPDPCPLPGLAGTAPL